jgi:hypothetical protein
MNFSSFDPRKPVLGLEEFDHDQLMTMNPTGHDHQQKLDMNRTRGIAKVALRGTSLLMVELDAQDTVRAFGENKVHESPSQDQSNCKPNSRPMAVVCS